MRRKNVVIAVILAVVVTVLGSRLLTAFNNAGAGRPDCEIVSKDFGMSLDGLDKFFYVYIAVRNRGESGNMAICVRFIQLGTHVSTQSRSLYLKSGESQQVNLEFSMVQWFLPSLLTG